MATDDTKLAFSSDWEIDQLVVTNQDSPTTFSSTPMALYTLPDVTALPDFKVQLKPTGSNKWYDVGENSVDGTFATLFILASYIQNGVLYVHSNAAGQVRYYIWSDKIDY